MTESASQVCSIIERIEHLNAAKADLNSDLSEVFKEAKANGFDVPALKAVVKYRAQDADKRAELDAQVELYLKQMGDA